MTGNAMILAGQLSALGTLGAAAVLVAVSPAAARALARAWGRYGPAARRRAREVRTRLHQLLAAEPPRPGWAAAAARHPAAHGRHVRIPHQRTGGA